MTYSVPKEMGCFVSIGSRTDISPNFRTDPLDASPIMSSNEREALLLVSVCPAQFLPGTLISELFHVTAQVRRVPHYGSTFLLTCG